MRVAGVDDDAKRRMMSQVVLLDDSYPGGLQAYIRNAKQLLRESKEGMAHCSTPAGANLHIFPSLASCW